MAPQRMKVVLVAVTRPRSVEPERHLVHSHEQGAVVGAAAEGVDQADELGAGVATTPTWDGPSSTGSLAAR